MPFIGMWAEKFAIEGITFFMNATRGHNEILVLEKICVNAIYVIVDIT